MKKLLTCLAVSCLLSPVVSGEWLPPQKEVFPLLSADPAASQFEASFFRIHRTLMGVGTLGENIAVWREDYDNGWTVQSGIEGSARMLLNMSNVGGNTALNAADYAIGVPLEFSYESLSLRLLLNHVSSHLGEGHMVEQELTAIVYSREAIEFLAAWRNPQFLLYGGGSTVVGGGGGSDVDYGMGFHGGVEVYTCEVVPETRWFGYFAADLQVKEESNRKSLVNMEIGAAFRNPESLRTFRLFTGYLSAPLPFGQYVHQSSESIISIGFSLDV